VNSLEVVELTSYLKSDNIESYTFKPDNFEIIFYIDKQSVISFPDFTKEEVVINVLTEISETMY
ncbi:hypothetical protein V7164_19190, partial [Bacillus sp. JJ1474]